MHMGHLKIDRMMSLLSKIIFSHELLFSEVSLVSSWVKVPSIVMPSLETMEYSKLLDRILKMRRKENPKK